MRLNSGRARGAGGFLAGAGFELQRTVRAPTPMARTTPTQRGPHTHWHYIPARHAPLCCTPTAPHLGFQTYTVTQTWQDLLTLGMCLLLPPGL